MKANLIMLICIAGVQTGLAQHHFQWLIGSWKLEGKDVYEVWTVTESNARLRGSSYRLSGSDTTITETINLEFMDGFFHYIPDVVGDQPPVDFRITSADDQSFVAENPHHDFPKIIRYRHRRDLDGEFLEAVIEGNGKVIPYSFRKIK